MKRNQGNSIRQYSKLKIKVLVGLVLILGLTIGSVIYWNLNKIPEGHKKVINYKHGDDSGGPLCQALSPECGYCPGEVIGKECYAKEN